MSELYFKELESRSEKRIKHLALASKNEESRLKEIKAIIKSPHYIKMYECMNMNKNLVDLCFSYLPCCVYHGIHVYKYCSTCDFISNSLVIREYILKHPITLEYKNTLVWHQDRGIFNEHHTVVKEISGYDFEVLSYWTRCATTISTRNLFFLDEKSRMRLMDNTPYEHQMTITICRGAKIKFNIPYLYVPCVLTSPTTISKFIVDD